MVSLGLFPHVTLFIPHLHPLGLEFSIILNVHILIQGTPILTFLISHIHHLEFKSVSSELNPQHWGSH